MRLMRNAAATRERERERDDEIKEFRLQTEEEFHPRIVAGVLQTIAAETAATIVPGSQVDAAEAPAKERRRRKRARGARADTYDKRA